VIEEILDLAAVGMSRRSHYREELDKLSRDKLDKIHESAKGHKDLPKDPDSTIVPYGRIYKVVMRLEQMDRDFYVEADNKKKAIQLARDDAWQIFRDDMKFSLVSAGLVSDEEARRAKESGILF